MHGRPYAQYRPAYPRYPRRDPELPGKPPAWRPRGRQAGEVSAVDAVGAGLRTRWPGRSGRVGAAHAAAALGGPLVLVEAAPGAVLLRPAERVVQALGPDRAGGADRLGLALADVPLRLALAVRAEEEHDITAAARRVILPAPVRPLHQGGLTRYLRHDLLSSTSSRAHSCPASAR